MLYKQRRLAAGYKLRATPDIPPGHKYCPDCLRVFKRSDFHSNLSQVSGLASYCKDCTSVRHGERHLRKSYGMTLADKLAMIQEQGGRCLICGAPDPQHVDHDHVTGEVRGVLCFNCNGGLGQFKDNPGLLWKAFQYLRGRAWRQDTPSEAGFRILVGEYQHRPSSTS